MNILSIEIYLNSGSKFLDMQSLFQSIFERKILEFIYTIFIYLNSYYYYLRVTLQIEFKHKITHQPNNEL